MLGKIFLFVFTVAAGDAFAQGCSDAGFCSAGAMQAASHQQKDSSIFNIAAVVSIAQGEPGTSTKVHHTTIIIPQVELTHSIGKRGIMELKLPYYYASGGFGKNSGIGDPIFSYTHRLKQNSKTTVNFTVGARISLGNASATGDTNFVLPMPYQANLGTTDLILGLGTNRKHLNVAIGYQQPILQYNQNTYTTSLIPEDIHYFSSHKLRRKGDVLFRFELHTRSKRFGFAGGPLFIYHIGMDNIELYGKRTSLAGSEGLTLNLSGNISYTAKKWKFDIAAGKPLLTRKVRPDGLTREWIATPRFTYMLY